jgi:hypothetical protein
MKDDSEEKTRAQAIEDAFQPPESRWKRLALFAVIYGLGLRARVGPSILRFVPMLVAAVLLLEWALTKGRSLESLGVAAAGAVIAIGVRSALHPGAVFSPLAVPKSLVEAGWTGEVVAGHILDQTNNLVGRFPAQSHYNPLEQFEPLPKIEVPGFKVGLDAFGDLLRELVGAPRMRIVGEIVLVDEGKAAVLRLRLRDLQRGSNAIEIGPQKTTNMKALIVASADKLLERIAPYNFSFALLNEGHPERALEVARMGAADPVHSSDVRAKCYVLQWQALLVLGRFDEALTALEQSAGTRINLLVIKAISEQCNRPELPQAMQRFWRRASMIAECWVPSDVKSSNIYKAVSAGRYIRWQRSMARDWASNARGRLLQGFSSRAKLATLQLDQSAKPRDLANYLYDINHALCHCTEMLKYAREADPDESCATVLATLDARRALLEGWAHRLGNDRKIVTGMKEIEADRRLNYYIATWATNFLKEWDDIFADDVMPGSSLSEARIGVRMALRGLKDFRDRRLPSPADHWAAEAWLDSQRKLDEAEKKLRPLLDQLRRVRPLVRRKVQSLRRAKTKLDHWHVEHRPPDSAFAELQRWNEMIAEMRRDDAERRLQPSEDPSLDKAASEIESLDSNTVS